MHMRLRPLVRSGSAVLGESEHAASQAFPGCLGREAGASRLMYGASVVVLNDSWRGAVRVVGCGEGYGIAEGVIRLRTHLI